METENATGVCLDCSSNLYDARRKRCEKCSPIHRQIRQHKQCCLKLCEICGAIIHGGSTKRCSNCKPNYNKKYSENYRDSHHSIKICVDCGCILTNTKTERRRGKKRCDLCNNTHIRDVQKYNRIKNYVPSTRVPMPKGQLHILTNLRARIRGALRHKTKYNKTNILLGCSIAYYEKFLERQFTEGMSWENYGMYGWHIDHIIPCSLFDFSKPRDQANCFHYTNTQPMWWDENIKKRDNFIILKNKEMNNTDFWCFFLKIRERLILIIENNYRNHQPLEELDEQVMAELYEWYLRTDLFQSDENKQSETATQTSIHDIKSDK